jgi:transposase
MRRLMQIPGVGPLTAHAVVTAIGDPKRFSTGRDFAAWAGLTPLTDSSAEKTRIGHISRQGDHSLRRLMVLGAVNMARHARARPCEANAWLNGVIARRPVKVAMVAQAAKTARIAWALLCSGENYRGRTAAA